MRHLVAYSNLYFACTGQVSAGSIFFHSTTTGVFQKMVTAQRVSFKNHQVSTWFPVRFLLLKRDLWSALVFRLPTSARDINYRTFSKLWPMTTNVIGFGNWTCERLTAVAGKTTRDTHEWCEIGSRDKRDVGKKTLSDPFEKRAVYFFHGRPICRN